VVYLGAANLKVVTANNYTTALSAIANTAITASISIITITTRKGCII
jgi:hypothetical protein